MRPDGERASRTGSRGRTLVVDPDLVKPPTNGCLCEVRLWVAGPRGGRTYEPIVTGIPSWREAEMMASLAQEVIDQDAHATMLKHVGRERVLA